MAEEGANQQKHKKLKKKQIKPHSTSKFKIEAPNRNKDTKTSFDT